jgi:hypothetical protein
VPRADLEHLTAAAATLAIVQGVERNAALAVIARGFREPGDDPPRLDSEQVAADIEALGAAVTRTRRVLGWMRS